MDFTPEIKILILNAVILAVAYLGIYPSLQEKTLNRIMAVDVVLSVLSLIVAGGLFWGTGVAFTLLFFKTNWAVFAILTLFVMEVPLFVWFARKHGIDIFNDPDS
jgi:hypothetical protein